MLVQNSTRALRLCVHISKISSIYCRNLSGRSFRLARNFDSKGCMQAIARSGAQQLPIARPLVCLKILFPRRTMLLQNGYGSQFPCNRSRSDHTGLYQRVGNYGNNCVYAFPNENAAVKVADIHWEGGGALRELTPENIIASGKVLFYVRQLRGDEPESNLEFGIQTKAIFLEYLRRKVLWVQTLWK